jgi:hypothetical protein
MSRFLLCTAASALGWRLENQRPPADIERVNPGVHVTIPGPQRHGKWTFGLVGVMVAAAIVVVFLFVAVPNLRANVGTTVLDEPILVHFVHPVSPFVIPIGVRVGVQTAFWTF